MRSIVLLFLLLTLHGLFAAPLHAAANAAPSATAIAIPSNLPEVGFAILKTSRVAVREALLVPGGSLSKEIDSNFSAFLIKHRDEYFLFDTGMGRQIDAQYRADMPLGWRPFFKYEAPVRPAREQLEQAGFFTQNKTLSRVILSHSHWDHAGGVLDFPEAKIAIAPAEMALVKNPSRGPGGSWASQIGSAAIQWEPLQFQAKPYRGYAQSLDLFEDGRVVLVPMPGHTPGSIGLFLTVDSGQVYFFIGDVAWTVEAIKAGAPKFWAASAVVDGHAEQTHKSVAQLRATLQQEPGLVLLPAHDSAVQDRLGYFPQWVK
ncbi:MBL fold metallo-hydrolase [Paucibacter sp. Y2R2-4]|uniref:MBL fold metallo-hydrolase n=1 Tax=Paucibacter sp. Y2R2-4 TaxID=2893553 RepID=UPI0021E36D79|nr:MBL fold metallo-hydrolase [Paucibacter sp. Y2R2-4]MCV2351221.1 MBL fold metallo-hydrolase [Paucibacter sp. Y2R2-4]